MEQRDEMIVGEEKLFFEIKATIQAARNSVARQVNSALVLLYWQIGKSINMYILEGQKASYGKKVIERLSFKLTQEFGRGYGKTNLFNCLKLAEVYPEFEIFHALSGKLSWTHLRNLVFIEDALKREFYTLLCIEENWSTRTLKEKIQSMLYERTAISKKPEETIARELEEMKVSGKMTPDLIFRDPYLLDFLNLSNSYSERDLETAILAELQSFISELGTDFAFLARQKRIVIDNDDFYIDLLFYHRRLRRLLAIDLKLGKFQAKDKGQMELYLRWLEKYEQREGEESPIGLILCAEKSDEKIELLKLEQGSIRVAEYLTSLPPRSLLEQKLEYAIQLAKSKISGHNSHESFEDQ